MILLVFCGFTQMRDCGFAVGCLAVDNFPQGFGIGVERESERERRNVHQPCPVSRNHSSVHTVLYCFLIKKKMQALIWKKK